MSRLTAGQRDTLRKRLLDALLPDDPAIEKLRLAAFDAVIRDFYGAEGLRRIAKLPDAWLTDVDQVHVGPIAQPEGPALRGYIHGQTRRLPRQLEHNYQPNGDTAGQACLAYFEASAARTKLRQSTEYEVDTVLAASTTLEALLIRLPAAREILSLPQACAPDAVAKSINARLAKPTRKS